MTSAKPNSMDDAGQPIADRSSPDSQAEMFAGGAGGAAGTAGKLAVIPASVP